ncbi:MAG: protein jag [Lachnospiraceae bacterium]|nr:protein jag [Lachnospiraceae bacterium]
MDFIEVSAKNVAEAVTEACRQLSITSEKLEYEVMDEGKTGVFGIGSRPAVIRAKVKDTLEDNVKSFLSDVFAAINFEVSISIQYNEEEKVVDVDLSGDDMGMLIGKRGQTLDSLQYLLSLVVNKNSEEYIRVKVDTENYREHRKETLENLAKNIASKVKRTGRSVSLEPMNPYERRIIHATLQNDKYVTTHSEGNEPYRRVVVTPKGNFRPENREWRYNSRPRRRSYED